MSCLCILLLVPLHLNNILLHRLLDSSVSDVSIPFFKYECIYIYTAWNLGCIFHIRAHIYLQFWRTISCYLFKYFLSSSSLPVQNSCKTWWEIFVLGSTFLACFVFSYFLVFFCFYFELIFRRWCFPSRKFWFCVQLYYSIQDFSGPG